MIIKELCEQSSNQHTNKQNQQQNQQMFIVEGNIGSGKSTFLSLIEKNLAVQVVYEPHTKWQDVGSGDNSSGENLLDRFYKDTPRWAYTFQSYAFITRVIEQQEKAKINIHNGIQVLERSVYSDRYCFAKNCYEMGTMSRLEWNLYTEWFSWLVDHYVPKPAGFIYLKTDPEICFQRLSKRSRSEEVGVSRQYLQLLHDKHEAWLLHKHDIAGYLQNVPVLVLDCNPEFENDEQQMAKHIQEIMSFITQHAAPVTMLEQNSLVSLL